jgi:phosphate transport system substrate-binding protein
MKKIFAIIIAAVLCIGLSACSTDFDAKKDIIVISRDSASGTREAFEKGVGLLVKDTTTGKDVSLLKSGAEEIASTGAVIEKVKSDVHSIGYISAGLISDEVNVLKVEGVDPTTANIKNGTYVLQRPFIIVYKEATLENALFADFEKFLRSNQAASIYAEEGVVALSGTVNGKEYGATYTTPSGLSGTINVEGSTSVGPVMQILAEEYKKLNSGVTINITENGSGNGLSSAKAGTSDFGMMSKDLSSTETSVVKTQLAIDGVAIIVNKKNTTTNITKAQIKAIYIEAGNDVEVITKWSQLA